ncbi:MGF 360-16R [African swine fever virus]|uniref:MGF 360-16R n=1 Tax=African swine fever virus TaxID=10497 RepID=A0A0C5AZ25_ASF|nr:MGF 360-16R [African swine fever virus]AJL34157.1 MGF 360-16R [African swine fever virus]
MLSLQATAKLAVAANTYSKNIHPILKVFGLWWKNNTLDGPVKICNHCNQIIVGEYPMCFNHGMSMDVALIRAVKDHNISLVQLFTEWGGNIDYGALCANTPSMQRLCESLGAKPPKGQMFMDTLIHLSDTLDDNDLIRGYEIFEENNVLNYVNLMQLKIILTLKTRIPLMEQLDQIALRQLLQRYWYAMAVQHNLKAAIHYFDNHIPNMKPFRLRCALYLNDPFKIHDACKTVNMDPNEMMNIACQQDLSFQSILYCYMLGADINKAMLMSLNHGNLSNMWFCIDLGADAFEEAGALAGKKNKRALQHILGLNIFKQELIPPCKDPDPFQIQLLLKNYTLKNVSTIFAYYCQ